MSRARRIPRRPPSTHERRGFILPFVLLAVAATSLLACAFTIEGLQSLRAVRGTAHGALASNAAEVALANALARYRDDSLWTVQIGRERTTTVTAHGQVVTVRWQRTHPLVAVLRAIAEPPVARRVDATRRDLYRAVWLDPPKVPVLAALATNGPVRSAVGAVVSGADSVLPGSPCGDQRDTASVAAVLANRIEGQPTGSWSGAMTVNSPPSAFLADLASALADVGTRVPARVLPSATEPLPPSHSWAAMWLRADTVAVRGPARFTGLLIVEGTLVLTGTIDMQGLLLVTGPLDAAAARLSVQGAVIAADSRASGVMLGPHTRLFFDRCAVQMALATVARPTLAPFSLWFSLPP
jgi:hypothetical protein